MCVLEGGGGGNEKRWRNSLTKSPSSFLCLCTLGRLSLATGCLRTMEVAFCLVLGLIDAVLCPILMAGSYLKLAGRVLFRSSASSSLSDCVRVCVCVCMCDVYHVLSSMGLCEQMLVCVCVCVCVCVWYDGDECVYVSVWCV